MALHRWMEVKMSGQFLDADIAELDEGSVTQEADVAGRATEARVTGQDFRLYAGVLFRRRHSSLASAS
jgi:hypothetical protein